MTRKTDPLAPKLRKQLSSIIDEVGEARARRALGLNRPALDRALAGLPIRPGSALLIEQALAQYAKSK